MLWILLLAAPFPYIANTAGWMTAEFGRQPWVVYGLVRTSDGYSTLVSAGNGWFSLLGFFGMYTVLGMLFLFLVLREIERGPETNGDNVGSVPIAPAAERGRETTEDKVNGFPVAPAKVR
jgi:cytochrome d ubiquinol oxidase subunit I